MEYINCEQYVLSELKEAQTVIAKLTQQNEQQRAQIELLEKQINAPKSEIEEIVEKKGREAVFNSWFCSITPAEDMSFDDWILQAMKSYCITKNLRAEALVFFEPELRETYEERTLEAQEVAE